MRIFIIQENGRHNANREFRECFSLKRAFDNLNIDCTVWGLGHINFGDEIDFNDYDLILNLENYDTTGWLPNLSHINAKKFLWAIDAHVRGETPYINEFNRGNYNILLHSTKDYVNNDKNVWFPNCYDDTLIKPLGVKKLYDVGFCGNVLNRRSHINILSRTFNFKFDEFVIGEYMVLAINGYKIHWNKNLSNDINYRNFETIGCNVPLVTNYNHQYKDLGFVDGYNCMLYENDIDMIHKITSLLSDDNLLSYISNNGYELAKKHTYNERANLLLKLFDDVSV